MNKISAFLFVLILTSNMVLAKDQLVSCYLKMPPLAFTTEGKPDGLIGSLVRKIVEKAGFDSVGKELPLARMIQAGLDGENQVGIGIRPTIPPYSEAILSSEEVVYRMKLNAYRTRYNHEVKERSELVGKRVALIKTYTYGEWGGWMRDKKNNLKIFEVANNEQGFNLLLKHRVDYFINYEDVVSEYLPIAQNEKEPILTNNLFDLPCHILLSKKVPDSEKVMQKLVAAYHQLISK